MHRCFNYTEIFSPTVFPDWTANNVQAWWQEAFDDFKAKAEYDGIWLDMNEPASFAEEREADDVMNESVGTGKGERPTKKIKVSRNKFDFPPYEVSLKTWPRVSSIVLMTRVDP